MATRPTTDPSEISAKPGIPPPATPVSVPPRAVPNGRPAALTPYEERVAKERREQWLRWGRLGVEVLLLLGLVIFTAQTYLANRSAANNLALGKQTLSAEQRPWIWIDNPGPFELQVGRVPALNFQLVNYGKTPGVVRSTMFLYGALIMNPYRIRDYQKRQVEPFSAIIAPSQRRPIVASGAGNEPLTQETYNAILQGEVILYAGGRVEYSGMDDGSHYESWFCVERLPSGAVASCPSSDANGMK